MEKQKLKSVLYCVSCYVLFAITIVCIILLIGWALPMGAEKTDNYFNSEQEIVEDRFTIECSTILNVYHDNELNVTCWETGYSNTGM